MCYPGNPICSPALVVLSMDTGVPRNLLFKKELFLRWWNLRNYNRYLVHVGAWNPSSIANAANFHTGMLTFREFQATQHRRKQSDVFPPAPQKPKGGQKRRKVMASGGKEQGRDIHLIRSQGAEGTSGPPFQVRKF